MKIELGQMVEDVVTGFKGRVTGMTIWMSGCDQAIVQPLLDKSGKKPDTEWFDVNRLKILKDKRLIISQYILEKKQKGGIQHTPKHDNR